MYRLTLCLLFLILFVSAPCASLLAQAAVTGYLTTTAESISNRSSSSGESWNNPGNAATDNNSYATFSNPALLIGGTQRTTNYLELKNFGFAIPLGQEITGVEVEVRRFSSDNSGTNWTRDHEIKLVKDGLVVGENRGRTTANWPIAETPSVYGSGIDLWGTTLTRDEVNSSDFGVAIAIQSRAAGILLPTVISYIDQVRIRVHYQPSVLPVGLKDFQAKLTGHQGIQAQWQTVSEQNNSHFIVQASVNGSVWTDLGKIASRAKNGNSSEIISYSFTSQMTGMAFAGFGVLGLLLLPMSRNRLVRAGVMIFGFSMLVSCAKEQWSGSDRGHDLVRTGKAVYLRLAQVDLDGTVSYSEVISVK